MESEKELWGHKFKIVDNGLDEAEVYSFVDGLTNQYSHFAERLEHLDTLVSRLADQYGNLARKLEHLDKLPETDLKDIHTADDDISTLKHPDILNTPTNGNSADFDIDKLENLDALTKFAERTVVEAAKQAKIIKTEMEEKAKVKANSIIAHAMEKASIEASRIITEAKLTTTESGKQIIAASQQEAQNLNNIDRGEVDRLVAEANKVTEQKVQAILSNVKEKVEESAQIVKQGAEQLKTKGSDVKKEELKGLFDGIHNNLLSILELFESPPNISTGEDATSAEDDDTETGEHMQPEPTSKKSQEKKTSSQAEQAENSTDIFDGTIELALPPPVALDIMLQLHKHLKEAPHVEVLNLGGSVEKGITIRIITDTPIPLLQVIGELPEVEAVSEEQPDGDENVPSRQSDEDPPVRRIIVTTKC
jgi:hypothetical protein